MFCNNCGKEIPDESKFCPECGEQICLPQSEVSSEVPNQIDAKKKLALPRASAEKLKVINRILLFVLIAVLAGSIALGILTARSSRAPAPVEAASEEEIDAWASQLYRESVEKLYEQGFTESKYSKGAFDFPAGVNTYGDQKDLTTGKYIVARRVSGFELNVRSKYSGSQAAAKYPEYPFYTVFTSDGGAVNLKFAKKFWAESLDDCDYLFVISGKTSNVEPNFYLGDHDRISVETDIVCIDVHKGEAVYIRSVYNDIPAEYNAESNRGEEKTILAENSISGLLNDMYEEGRFFPWKIRQSLMEYVFIDIFKVPVAVIFGFVKGIKERKKRRALKTRIAEAPTGQESAVPSEDMPVPRRTGGLIAWACFTVTLLLVPAVFALINISRINKAAGAHEQADAKTRALFWCALGSVAGIVAVVTAVMVNM